MTEEQLTNLKEKYTSKLCHDMDMKTMHEIAYGAVLENFEDYNEEELVSEILDSYDEETLKELQA